MSRPEYVILRSKDEVPIEVESQILGKCAVLGIDTTCDVDKELPPVEIPIHNVTEVVLRKVLEWLEHHRDDNEMDETSEWNLRFINVDQEMLFEIILAANYLDIKPLLNIACGSVANMIKGKTPEEIRKIFKIANDSTTEEEA